MNRPTIWTLILTRALLSAAEAAPTPELKCQAAKLNAIRTRKSCIVGERRKEVLGKTSNSAKCEASFAKAIAAADKAAAVRTAARRSRPRIVPQGRRQSASIASRMLSSRRSPTRRASPTWRCVS